MVTALIVGVICTGVFILLGPIGVIIVGLLLLLGGVSNKSKD